MSALERTSIADLSRTKPEAAAPALARGVGRWGRGRRGALLALMLVAPAPVLGVLAPRIVPGIQGELTGRLIYFSAKAWIIALPVLWHVLIDRQRIGLSPARRGGLGAGALLGGAIFVVITLTYWIAGRAWIDPEAVRAEVGSNGVGRPLVYVPLVCGLSLVNALIEEYVWRWFVFRKCERLIGPVGAVLLGSALFTLHHVVALRAHAGWDVTVLGSIGCFLGGTIWSILYLRYRSIWPCYFSHICADAAIYLIGWLLIFGGS